MVEGIAKLEKRVKKVIHRGVEDGHSWMHRNHTSQHGSGIQLNQKAMHVDNEPKSDGE